MNHYSGHDPERGCAYILILGLAIVAITLIVVVVWITYHPLHLV